MEIAVADANILIDLANSGLVPFCVKLGIDFRTIDIVYAEITDNSQHTAIQRLVDDGVLAICELTPSDVERVYEMYEGYLGVSNLSFQDVAVMLYALEHRCLLLTGDRKLREKAAAQEVRVAGILYLTDMMTQLGVISSEAMVTALQTLLKSNARLPKSLIQERIKKLQNGRK